MRNLAILIASIAVCSVAHAQGKVGPNPNANLPHVLKAGGSAARPSGVPPFVRKRSDLDKWHVGKGPGLKSGPPPVGTQLFSFSITAPISALAEVNPVMHAPGSIFFDTTKGRMHVPHRTSSGLDEVVWIAMLPYAGTETTFECSVTPNQKYSTAIDAYYSATDRDEIIGTAYGLSVTGNVTVIYDSITPAPDFVFIDLWSPDSDFDLFGCKAQRTG